MDPDPGDHGGSRDLPVLWRRDDHSGDLGSLRGRGSDDRPGRLQPLVVPISIAILVGLFFVQSRGTAKVGSIFGPVMISFRCPCDPRPVEHLATRRLSGSSTRLGRWDFLLTTRSSLSSRSARCFMCHRRGGTLCRHGPFRPKGDQLSWLTLVYPCLILNYMGQGALLLSNPQAAINPFYLLAPDWARLPLVFLATIATIIASQAVISGAFSITHQAVQLGFLPRLRTEHTSEKALGQIYIPAVNWSLLVMVIVLVLGFRASSNLASAYGIAVTGTMLITSIMLAVLMFYVWKWNCCWRRRHRPVPARRRHLLRFEPDEDPGRRLVPAIDCRDQLHGLDDLGQGSALMRARLQESALPLAVFIKSTAASVHRVRGTSVSFRPRPSRSRRVAPQSEAQPSAPRAESDPEREGRGSATRPG